MIAHREEHTFEHLIIDETSMVSLKLFHRFICAFSGQRYRITLIGDPYQIQPIEWGNVLKELIESSTIPLVRLKKIYRVQTEEGLFDRIVENSKRIAYWKDSSFDFVKGDNFDVRDGDKGDIMQNIKKMNVEGFRRRILL